MRMHDVERTVGRVERVRVADLEAHVRHARGRREGSRLLDDLLARVDAHDLAVADAPREVDGDRARSAAHVEDALTALEEGHEVRGGVLDGARRVRARDGLVVAVGVDDVAHDSRA